jgi:hypothetical protein
MEHKEVKVHVVGKDAKVAKADMVAMVVIVMVDVVVVIGVVVDAVVVDVVVDVVAVEVHKDAADLLVVTVNVDAEADEASKDIKVHKAMDHKVELVPKVIWVVVLPLCCLR